MQPLNRTRDMSEASERTAKETAQRLFWAFADRLCNKVPFQVSWLNCGFFITEITLTQVSVFSIRVHAFYWIWQVMKYSVPETVTILTCFGAAILLHAYVSLSCDSLEHLSCLVTKPPRWPVRPISPVWSESSLLMPQADQSLLCPHKETMCTWLSIERTAKALITLGGFPGWSESPLGAQVILLVLSWNGSFLVLSLYILYKAIASTALV